MKQASGFVRGACFTSWIVAILLPLDQIIIRFLPKKFVAKYTISFNISMELQQKYDVIILGGGLAGLTLARQLKQAAPEISIKILEKRAADAPVATHKVGESTSELGSFYLREVIGLKAYLTEHQLPKFGFRFFLSPEHSDDIALRVEVGSRHPNPFQTHQVDRGVLENELVRRLLDAGVALTLGAKVGTLELSKDGHIIHFECAGKEYQCMATWVVDASGRSGLLKRKLGLEKAMDHQINAAWFRLGTEIDIDDWSDKQQWRDLVAPGRRHLATNHLMGEGYWVWIIPLVSGCTSIGIVADPKYHPFESFNTFDKAMAWLETHEPNAAKMLEKHRQKLLDFKLMKNFAYDTKQFFSADRWALTGEAGAFMDPFYSPGTDFIGLGNSWISDLIVRDLSGEDVLQRSKIYDFAQKELLAGWTLLYKNMYGLFGKTQIMLLKIMWDWASYWAVPNVIFMNGGYTDLAFLKQYASSAASLGRRFAKLNERMQELFQHFGQHPMEALANAHINVFDLGCLYQFQSELGRQYSKELLMAKVESNLEILEQIAAEIFRRVSSQIHGTPLDMKIDPYGMSIADGKAELLQKSAGKGAFEPMASIKADIATVWLMLNAAHKAEMAGNVADKMAYIQNLFLGIPEKMQQRQELDALIVLLDTEAPEFRSIAYESASMEIGLQALSMGGDLNLWEKFYHRSEKAHTLHMAIGLGWAFAKTETLPVRQLGFLSPAIQEMVFDGIGYYNGLYRGRRTIKSQLLPAGIEGAALRGFDQGLGRRLWYVCKGELKELADLFQPFPPSRHPDLWRGVGIACGYVGGSSTASLEKLAILAGEWRQQLSSGVTLAAITRQASGSITDGVEKACQIICKKSVEDLTTF